MTTLSLVMPYYRNPGMLAFHYAHWATLPAFVAQELEVVIVDDGSPEERAIDVPRLPDLPRLSIYRVLEDRLWHQHGARNLGANVATGRWLLLTDMDHAVPSETFKRMLTRPLDDRCAYMFPRVDAPTMTTTLDRHGKPKPHPNTFLLTRQLFWEVGGYDEDYCGIYGTDGLFRRRLWGKAKRAEFDLPVVRYSRDVIPDASTRDVKRKEGRDLHTKRRVLAMKKQARRSDQITTLNFEWEREL